MPTREKPVKAVEPLAYSVAQLPHVMGLGASVTNGLLKTGVLPCRKHGKRTLVLRSDIEAYMQSLPIRSPRPIPAPLPVNPDLPTVADDPANPSPLDRILDTAMHAELAAIRRPSLLGPDYVDALTIRPGPRGDNANDFLPVEAGEDI